MTDNKNNIPIYAEQIIIEQTPEEKITELREKIRILQEELTEKEEENEELDRLVWKGIEKLNKKVEEEKELKIRFDNLKSKILGSLFKNKKKKKVINELNASLSFLRGLLVEKNQEVVRLTTERDNRPNIIHQEYNDLLQERNCIQNQLTTANNLIANLRTLLRTNDLDNLPQIPEGETLTTLLAKPTQEQLNNLQQELDKEKGWWDKWMENSGEGYGQYRERLLTYEYSWGGSKYYDGKAFVRISLNYFDEFKNDIVPYEAFYFDFSSRTKRRMSYWSMKERIKTLYEYYKNK